MLIWFLFFGVWDLGLVVGFLFCCCFLFKGVIILLYVLLEDGGLGFEFVVV